MIRNLASWDRLFRVAVAIALAAAAIATSSSLPVRLAGVAAGALMLLTATLGWCPGYRLLGISTCARREHGRSA
jgi:hypothetical protein